MKVILNLSKEIDKILKNKNTNMLTTEEITSQINDLENQLADLRKILSEKNGSVLMYMKKSGKHTFVLQPIKQLENLKSSGWKRINQSELNEFLNDFNLK